MTTQTEQLFLRTTLELLEELAKVHRAEYDKAMKALDALSDDEKIARAYEKAEDRLAKVRLLVAAIDQAAERERKRLTTPEPTVEDAIRDMKRTAEESGTRVTLSTGGKSVTFGAKAVDPITGEVASCDNCTSSDCNLKQQAGSDAMGCGGRSWLHAEVTPAVVVALYPGDDEPHETEVGDRTRYSELVADYFTEAGLNAEVDADRWGVDARRELTQDGGGYRSLHDVIVADDYGQELLVVALEQGSVMGAPAEKVAT